MYIELTANATTENDDNHRPIFLPEDSAACPIGTADIRMSGEWHKSETSKQQ
jgi:hypothetical protein